MKSNGSYNIGLDIGTSSIGWTIVDDDFHLLKAKGKQGYGVRIFNEGKTAADRRGFRTTRRRLNRRKWRLRLLQDIFEPYILPIDKNFFMRQKESGLVDQDVNKHFSGSILFDNQSDKEFYKKYHTIYHLRHDLMTEHKRFDIREIYLAIHHIVKYRGHFLNGAPASSFKGGQLDLADKFETLNELFERVQAETAFKLNVDDALKAKGVLLDMKKSRQDRQREIIKFVYANSDDKDIERLRKAIATELFKAVLGMKTKLFKIIAKNPVSEGDWTFSFDAEDIDDKLDAITDQLDDDDLDIVEVIKEIHSIITLAGVVPEGKGLSEAMIDSYNKHHEDLILLKTLANDLGDEQNLALRSAYGRYIDGSGGKKATAEEFYKDVKKVLEKVDDERAKKILAEIDLEEFMPKQRTKANGQIPHQLHQKELDQIIENQKEFYPWLAEKNSNEKNLRIAPYKLDELVTFRVPYYIGPLVEPAVQQRPENSGAKFAWMKRKSNGEITPWNFDDKVDRNISAERFIKRMTLKDTYLINEDVLPKQSLLYQKFEVLNELNNVRINGELIDNGCKQSVYRDVFKKHATVTIKRFKDYLISSSVCDSNPKIEGLADEHAFLSGLSTENKLRKIFGAGIDDKSRLQDFEKIVEWATIFEDNQILRSKLDEIKWLSEDQKKQLASLRFRGWGRLSEKLLAGIVDENGDTIISLMWKRTANFMSLVKQDIFQEKILQNNQVALSEKNIADVIDEQYTSPQNKKALRQILLVVSDIQKAMGGRPPKKVFIEFARENEKNPRRSVQRANQLKTMYEKIDNEILADADVRDELNNVDNSSLNKDRLFLYFLQGGIDLYTGKKIKIDQLSNYDIDHILPQAFIKDDSLDNRVLVSPTVNRTKSDNVPLSDNTSERHGSNMISKWKVLHQAGLISKRKLDNLMFNPDNISKHTRSGFINRQLVETRQVIKLAANVLQDKYQGDTDIVTVKAGLTHQFRVDFDFPKNRNVNNYHHAFDAYLTSFVGMYLLKQYPNLKSYFVYGEFKKGVEISKLNNFNFLHDLKAKKMVTNKETGELIVDKNKQLEYMNKIYDFKKVTVTHEVRERHGAMYDQTLYKASDDKASGRGKRQLIPKKKGMPTSIYGGYTGSTDSFMSIIRLKKKDEFYYRVVGIPTRIASDVQNGKGKIDIKKLNQYITDKLTTTKRNRKTKELVKSTEWFELVVAKARYGQIIVDGGQPFMLGSSTYPYSVRELYLSKNLIQIINNDPSLNTTDKYRTVFKEIVSSVNKYFPMYERNQFIQKLNSADDKFNNLPDTDVYEKSKLQQVGKGTAINRILIGLHANPARSDLKVLGISTPFGLLQQSRGIMLTNNAKIVYQSVTGLFEKTVAVKNLKPLA